MDFEILELTSGASSNRLLGALSLMVQLTFERQEFDDVCDVCAMSDFTLELLYSPSLFEVALGREAADDLLSHERLSLHGMLLGLSDLGS